ncbi:MAG: acyloxyacyl hydrolase [Paraburkholderia sp.]|uniref:Lipid A deacylase n=1 Tax=Paraburkholderia denitrificans TaxID=694025 RepID=A0ABW0JEY6_9BURK|nr:acyloxyacyl hydrolase [Paraburkholderia sp.]TAM08422.1 MAG: acyloxyacyl hydrolase [Paraburkholderia sp.]
MLKRKLPLAFLFAGLLAGSTAAHAARWGVQLAGGVADHDVKKADLGGVWDPGWQWWKIGGYHFTVVGEGHVAYWDLEEKPVSHANIWEFGFTPVFRFVKSSGYIRPFIEAGVGVRLLSHVDETRDRSFSSSFQFADMVGVGAQFGERQNYQAGFRFQHLSNAGLKHPNPGVNFSQIYLQYNF